MVVVRNILAVILGVIAGGIAVAAIEAAGMAMFPLPAKAEPNNAEWLKANIDKVPLGAMIAVTVAWFAGVLVASTVAGLVAATRKLLLAFIAGDFLLVMTLFTLVKIPHPDWMWPAGIAAVVTAQGMALVAGFLLGGWRFDR
jgi:hypothetical protein